MAKRIFLVCVLFIFPITGSLAAMLGWKGLYPGLNEEDIQFIRHTARTEMEGQPEGTVLKWENPKSKAKGVVKLIKRFYEEGRECRRNQHSFKVIGSSPWSTIVTICRQEDGSWKLLER